jgi:hypothetical protein
VKFRIFLFILLGSLSFGGGCSQRDDNQTLNTQSQIDELRAQLKTQETEIYSNQAALRFDEFDGIQNNNIISNNFSALNTRVFAFTWASISPTSKGYSF